MINTSNNDMSISGIIAPRKPYSKEFINTILAKIPEARKQFDQKYPEVVDHENMLYKHTRYNNDSRVIAVLESNIEEKYFDTSRLINYIFSVLKDAANADYYYCFEKDYGTPDRDSDDDVN